MTTTITDSHLAHLYKVSDVVSGKFYVGKHGGVKQGGYWGSGIRLKSHINKHGKTNMKYEILAIGTQEYIYDLEKAYVDEQFIKNNANCLNLTKGGMGGNLGGIPYNKGKPMSLEQKQKISIAKIGKPSPRKGVKLTKEAVAKISLSKMGRKNSEAHNLKLSLLLKGKKLVKVTCPNCNKIGGFPAMKRWHMDNCKDKQWLPQ